MSTSSLSALSSQLASGQVRVIDLTQTLSESFPALQLPPQFGQVQGFRKQRISQYDEATAEEVAEIGALTQTAMRVAREVLGCDGFNIGMNQGEIAGAGIAAHLHQHIVPRWASDANFFPIIAKTKALPQLLGDLRASITAAWPVDPGPAI